MCNYINKITREIGFPEEAASFFDTFGEGLTDADFALLSDMEAYYIGSADDANQRTEERLNEWAEQRGFNRYTAHLYFLLTCTRRLEERYAAAGIDRALFVNLMCDLRYKLIECRHMHGVWGTFVFSWFRRHFLMTRFALGRFQFEENPFDRDCYEAHGVRIVRGERIINFHIPSSGPMTREARLDAYRRAYDFYKIPEGGKLVLRCDSWLIYPQCRDVFPAGSNLRDFMDDFDILDGKCTPGTFNNAWRVFYKDYNGDTSILPRETSLQRAIADWLDKGNGIGSGYGIIVFDGEKILTGPRA
ncbi:MAG: DUF5596 domain-containing protein [Clostridia bacterium]|nr:DUF5596 domain-containing protein [Clostridia bacterium]